MTFSTLEERFNQVSSQIYSRFTPSEDQLVYVKPNTNDIIFGSKSRVKDDSRLLPLVSTARDIRRVSAFLKSPKGQLFLGKQVLLQTGNTFKETQVYNPIEALINTDPLIGRKSVRHSDLSDLFNLKTPTRENRGGLQEGTVTKISTPLDPTTGRPRLMPNGFYLRPEDEVFYAFGATQFSVQPVGQRGTVKSPPSSTTNPETTLFTEFLNFGTQTDGQGRSFKDLENTRFTNGYFLGTTLNVLDIAPDTDNADIIKTSSERFGDPYNVVPKEASGVGLYQFIQGTRPAADNDIIKFIFTTNQLGAAPVHFRAFISTFKQNVKTEYAEQRYVGRTERFVTYGGAKRTATLEFDIAAFSAGEINQTWARVNYLTGLAFPTGYSLNGFMIPPLFKLTVGNIYENQPCYIETLDFDLITDTTTFDIDEEVTQVIHVNMAITLLEKNTKFYDSPFYKITENFVKPQEQQVAAEPVVSNVANATADVAKAEVVATTPPTPPVQRQQRQPTPAPVAQERPTRSEAANAVLRQQNYRGEYTVRPSGATRQLAPNERIAQAQRDFKPRTSFASKNPSGVADSFQRNLLTGRVNPLTALNQGRIVGTTGRLTFRP